MFPRIFQKSWILLATLFRWALDILPYFMERIRRSINGKATYEEVEMSGKIVIITGASSGLGKEMVYEMVNRGAHVVLACRNLVEGEKVIVDTKRRTSKGRMDLLQLDLASLDSIRKFATKFNSNYTKLDVLINNAGFYDSSPVRKVTADGFEQHIGVNHLGHFLLTNLLLSNLKAAGNSRVITISSHAQVFQNLNLKDLMMERTGYGLFNFSPYANSKFANSLFAKELARREGGGGAGMIKSYSVAPGMVITRFYETQKPWYENLVFYSGLGLFGESTNQGCETIVYLAVAKEVENEKSSNGQLYHFNHAIKSLNSKLTDKLASDLWDLSEELVKLKKVS